MAARNKQAHPLNFGALILKDRLDNPLQILASRRRKSTTAKPSPAGEGTTVHSDNTSGNFETIEQDSIRAAELSNHTPRQEALSPLRLERQQTFLAHPIVSRRRPKLHPTIRLTVDPSILIYSQAPNALVHSPLSVSPSASAPGLVFPLRPKHSPTLSITPPESHRHPHPNAHSPRSSTPTSSQTSFVVTPTSGASYSRSYFSHNHSSLSTPSAGPRAHPPQKHCKKSPSTAPDPPISHPHQRASLNKPREYSALSDSPPGSISSLSSLSRSSTDQPIPLASPALINPWPVPPSSANTLSSFPSDWPKKSATYYPLRTWTYAPRPDPSILIPVQRPSSTLAYLDLSSTHMSHRASSSPTMLPSQSLGTKSHSASDDDPITTGNNGQHPTSDDPPITIRPASIISHKSRASRDSCYEDAPDKAEWMEIDSGDAYDDLEKTEKTVRKISQRLSLLNSVQAINLAVEARTRFHAMSENRKSQDLSTLFHSIPAARTAHTPVNHSQQSTSSQPTDQNITSSSDRDSYGSWRTSSSSRSHQSLVSSELDRNSSRSSPGMDRLSLGGVPLFTRITLFREDREEDKDKELEPIAEAPDLERAEEPSRMTGSPSSTGNRRRLKPLILRTTPSNPYSARRRTFSAPQPIYEAQSLLVSNLDTNTSSQKSNDPVTLKDSELSSGVSTELQEQSPPRSIDGPDGSNAGDMDTLLQAKPAFQEAIVEIIFPNPGEHVEEATEHANNDPIPVINFLKQRSGTFGMHSSKPTWAVQSNPSVTSKPTWAVQSNPSVNIIPSESSVNLPIEEDSTPFPPELQKSFADIEHARSKSDTSVALKPSLKSFIPPINTQLLPSVRQRTSSHHSTKTGRSEDITVVSAPAKTESLSAPSKTESLSSAKQDSPARHRRRCISNLCMPRNVHSQDRGISAASYAAAKLAQRNLSNLSVPSDPMTPDTLIITSAPPLTWPPPTGESRSESSGSHEHDKELTGLAEATLGSPEKKSRLFMTLGRMQARDAKVLDLTGIHLPSADDPAPILQDAHGQPKLIKGKLKRISKPILLQGEDERLALWGMISNGKLAHSHR